MGSMRMLRILGSKKRLCNGITRRDLLHVGGIGALGLGLNTTAQTSLTASGLSNQKPRAKSCIFVFLFGSPPQHETFDPKPQAPAQIQGEMKAIDTVVPGLQIGEGLPKIAQITDRLTVVRSMTHDYPIHCCAYVMTGMPTYNIPLETNPRAPEHWPYLGSVVDYLDGRRSGRRSPPLPRNIGLPWRFCSKGSSSDQAGPYAAFLGNSYDPFWTDFTGQGTVIVPKLAYGKTEQVREPHGGIEASSRTVLDRSAEFGNYDAHQQRAMSLIGSNRIREAIDVGRESPAMRERYGMNLFGQSCLAARRLVEVGARFVSVFWDPFGPHGASVWDTHSNHFPRLKNYLLPVFDQSYSTLIRDLEDHGLLDETLVLCTSEHGRTPQIDSGPVGGARHHWSRAYSSVFAGGGMSLGKIVGQTDAIAGDVIDTPISPKDMQATAYHLLGYDESTTIPDQQGRPHPIAGDGRVRPELLG
ncbi:MAG: DUF1501 domain-containing protein [Schlesneria sp.]